MALRVLQFGLVFAIGYCLGPATPLAGVAGVPGPPLSVRLSDPADVTVRKGQSATLRCDASALSGAVRVTWYHDDEPIPANDTRRRQRDDGSLHIARAGGVAGEYRCRAAAGGVALLSNPARLRIASFGEFNYQPSNLSVPESQPAVIFCNIHSVPTPQIKWELNTKPLPHNTRYVPLPTGALLITKTHSSDEGSYRCIATNSLLKKTKHSKIVQLTVTSNPTKTVAPAVLPLDILPNTTVLVGENISLYCAVTGWPIPTVQWLNRDGAVVSNSTVLEIRNATLRNAGNYTCRASNGVGRALQKYSLEVRQGPRFNVTPASISYPPAKTVRLDCKAEGSPEPRVYWLKNGEPLPRRARIKRLPGGLVFSHTFSYDAGIYQCFAVNAVGKIWAAAQLIQTPFNIPSPPEQVQCSTFDDSSVCLSWQQPKNISVTAYSIYSFYTAMGLETAGPEYVTNKTHHLATGLKISTNYTFYVRLYSNIASDQSQEVTCSTGVNGSRNLQVTPLNDTSVQLTWSKVSSDVPCGGTKEFYKVQWKRKGRSAASSDHTGGFTYVVSGLSYAIEYEFRVTSTTLKNDNSPWLTYLALGSDDTHRSDNNTADVIPNPPEQLEVRIVSATSVNLTWLDTNDDTKYYSICIVDIERQSGCDESDLMKSVSPSIQIAALRPDAPYEFRVRAHRADGLPGPSAASGEVRTPADVPSNVLGLGHEVVNATAACLHWRAPLRKRSGLTAYLVSYTPEDDWLLDRWLNKSVGAAEGAKGCWSGDDQAISTLLADLNPDKQYTVYVRAVSKEGLGNPSYPIKLNTNSVRNVEGPELQDDIHYNQKLGIIMGVTISLICIIFCVSCILVRKRCLKTRAFARARMAASNNYYPAVAHYASEGSSVQVRLESPCSAEMHEIEHLVGDDCTNHIPAIAPAHLDTKGTDGLPNGHINGSAKPYINGHIANGIVHITENPRYYMLECNGHAPTGPAPLCCPTYEEDSNSNLKTSKFHDLHRLFETSKAKVPEVTSRRPKAKAGSRSSSEEGGLNATRLTRLDDSFASQHGGVSPVVGPNGREMLRSIIEKCS